MTDRTQLVLLGRRYLAPQWRPLAALVGAGLATAGLAALLPTLLAPMLDLALGRMPAPPVLPVRRSRRRLPPTKRSRVRP